MFGIFMKNPSLLKILPGVMPGFKRFLKKVDDLLPKEDGNKPSSKRRKSVKLQDLSESDLTISNSESGTKSQVVEKELTVKDMMERFEKWFKKELPSRSPKTSVQDAMNRFTLKKNPNSSYTFKCIHCDVICNIAYAGTKTTISSATKHLKLCWLSSNKKVKVKTNQPLLCKFYNAKPPSQLHVKGRTNDTDNYTYITDENDPLGHQDQDFSISSPANLPSPSLDYPPSTSSLISPRKPLKPVTGITVGAAITPHSTLMSNFSNPLQAAFPSIATVNESQTTIKGSPNDITNSTTNTSISVSTNMSQNIISSSTTTTTWNSSVLIDASHGISTTNSLAYDAHTTAITCTSEPTHISHDISNTTTSTISKN